MTAVQKGMKRRVPLVVLAMICGFLASLVDSIRQHNQLMCTSRMLWCTLVIAVLFFLFVLFLGIYWLG